MAELLRGNLKTIRAYLLKGRLQRTMDLCVSGMGGKVY